MPPLNGKPGPVWRGLDFIRRQQRDWKVTVTRTSSHRFFYQMVFPYLFVYTVALGATATQLGIINSIGMGIAGIVSPFAGWLIDRIGTKKIYLIGITLVAIAYFTYGVAQSWPIIIIALTAYWLGDTTSIHSCATICANSLGNAERATGMAFCETLTAGLLGMVGPMLGAILVTSFGGVNVNGIRPLFFITLAGTLATFALVLTQLQNRRWGERSQERPDILKDFSQVFRQGRNLKRWLIINSLVYLPHGMILPFTQVFAHEIKGADQFVLGAMVTGMALTSLVLGIPMGRLADKIGRKKVLYLTAFLFWTSSLLLISAPNHAILIAAGAFQGFLFIYLPISAAMTFELVPSEQMGRWLGIVRLFRMLGAAGLAYLAGAIWDHVGPQYLFLIAVALDAFIRIPLLIGMPETIRMRREPEITE
ncbi:MFS transporter [Chloroflexota bacterium]